MFKNIFSDYLAPFSALANVFTAVSVAIIFSYLVPNLQNPVDNPSFAPTQDFEKFALFFGTAIFSFEGISVVLPLENNAETPEDFPKGKGSHFFPLLLISGISIDLFKSAQSWNGDGYRFVCYNGRTWLLNFWRSNLWFDHTQSTREAHLCDSQNVIHCCNLCLVCSSVLCTDYVLVAAY